MKAEDGMPLIGAPLGRKMLHRKGALIREGFRRGKFFGWGDDARTHPIIEYPDGTRETLQSLAETDWWTA